ncbi:N-acetylglucosamine-6-phosphate deacetylase [Tessaracoccus terricola]
MAERIEVGRAVTPEGVIENAVLVVEDGRIVAVEQAASVSGEFASLVAVPGFVDTHCHGADGVSFGNPDADANRRAVAYHLRNGSTTVFGSTVTASVYDIVEQVGVLRGLYDSGELGGIHLEGPFLAPEKKGAHDAALLIDPDPATVERLIEAGGPALKMVTMATERNHSREAIARFREAGVKVAFGHSDADEAKTRDALDWGADLVTHLFNAMRSIHHREAGPVPVLLTDERCMVELICDGVHHAPVIARMAIDAAGVDRVAMVTDAMSATGLGDGHYILGALPVEVKSGTARLVTDDGSQGAIAGSTLTMAGAFQYLVQQVDCSLEEAAIMCATTPARWHGLGDVGELAPGRFADLCLVDDGGALHAVIRRGRRVPA